jgi:hypothetical protein
MYKQNVKYKLTGYRPNGIYTVPRMEIAEWKNGNWYPYGFNKMLVNFIIEKIEEENGTTNLLE